MKRLQIAVFGSDGSHCSDRAKKIAEEVGKEIAKAGAILITGGGSGVMESACKGAKKEKGLTVGILPDDKMENSNKYCDVRIPTGIGFARNLMNVNSSDGVILIGGGIGTLTEAAYSYFYKKPTVAIVGSGGIADEIAGKHLDERKIQEIIPAKNAKEAVNIILKKCQA